MARGRSSRNVDDSARAVALHALLRVERDGAYANLALGPLLARSRLDERDRRFATELVYGSVRRQRACDFLVDAHLLRPVDDAVRCVLRLGAYQLRFAGVAPHAAVNATVAIAPKPARGLVNAVLRKVASQHDVEWPDVATELSYPDWIVEQLRRELGDDDAIAALRQMNEPPDVHVRDDGYVQDVASQWVAASVGVAPNMRVADVCAAPGGKATAMATTGATVVAGDVDETRSRLVAANRDRVRPDGRVSVFVGDARRPPLSPARFDRVLVDAPCTGLGTLRRRPDARWRIDEDAVNRLAALQRELVDATVELVAVGGVLVYSVCTITEAETRGIDHHLAATRSDLQPLAHLDPPWRPHGRGNLLLPHDAGTDGMYVLRVRRDESL